ncbi:hypothetical protein PAEPH01_0801 [Pancytospora epiphaga]|nr:hypothetical protein PAEPH01_0801 [Pancytospora epiphaga]
MSRNPVCRAFNKLLKQRRETMFKAVDIENRIFKLESAYQQLSAGMPITRNIEFYLSNKVEKKKIGPGDLQMLFSTEYPRSKNTPL